MESKYKEQRDFAADIGITPSIVSEWKRRVSASYSKPKHIERIALVLGTTVQWLVTGGELPGEAGWDTVADRPDFLVKFNSLPAEDKEEILAIIEVKHARQIKRKGKT